MTTVESEIIKAHEPAMRQRHTRIIVTLGPACATPELIGELICAGTDIFRINASHADVETQARYVEMVRESSRDCDVHIGILLDLQGPKIRLGVFQAGSICLRKDELFWITTQEIVGTEAEVSTTYRSFASDVRAGDRVLLADGAVELVVLQSDGTRTECRVVRGGVISDHQGINLPGTQLSAPSLTDKDRVDLEAGIRQHVDMIAMSFVRSAADIIDLRENLKQKSVMLPIIAKIERPEACKRHRRGLLHR